MNGERTRVLRDAMTLKAVAMSANQGRLSVGTGRYGSVISTDPSPGRSKDSYDHHYNGYLVGEGMTPQDAAFFALANPKKVLQIISQLEHACDEIATLRRNLKDHLEQLRNGRNVCNDLAERFSLLLGVAGIPSSVTTNAEERMIVDEEMRHPGIP